jgi:hypothetical protein
MVSSLSGLDVAVILVLSIQATTIAYVKPAKWKALLLSLPIPFTCMTLVAGRAVDVTTVLGLDLFFLFMQAVRWLHQEKRMPIVPAIFISTAVYCAVGTGLAAVVPRTATSYWLATIGTFAVGLAAFRLLPYRPEPGHRSTLPLWMKWPIIAAIVLFLVGGRGYLQGFATVFPIMGTISCYEARHSLWTVARQAALIALVMSVMVIVPYLTMPLVGMVPSLAAGWMLWAILFLPISGRQWARAEAGAARPGPTTDDGADARTLAPRRGDQG